MVSEVHAVKANTAIEIDDDVCIQPQISQMTLVLLHINGLYVVIIVYFDMID